MADDMGGADVRLMFITLRKNLFLRKFKKS